MHSKIQKNLYIQNNMSKKITIAMTGSNGTLGKRFRKIYKNYKFKLISFDITNKSK